MAALKDFDYSCSLGYKLRQKVMELRRRNERCQRPKTSCFDFSFLLLSRTNISSTETFSRSLCKILILCYVLHLGCLRILAAS